MENGLKLIKCYLIGSLCNLVNTFLHIFKKKNVIVANLIKKY